MTRLLLALLVCACFFTSAAQARPSHHVSHKSKMMGLYVTGCSDPVMRPCGQFAKSQDYFSVYFQKSKKRRNDSRIDRRTRIDRSHLEGSACPARYIGGGLVCAVNVNAELARRGIRGAGSALAKSFLRWGRESRPVAGAVAIYGRRGGGHVAIVSRVVNGRVYVWNPSSRSHRWREVEYRKRAIAYRVAGR
jgi:hypothetical protein